MSGIFGILSKTGTALNAHRYSMEITSNNINNLNTPGYTRKQALLQNSAFGVAGGVTVEHIMQAKDEFTDKQIINQNMSRGQHQSQTQVLSRIEAYFDEENPNNLADSIQEFFDSLQQLSTNPSDSIFRKQVLNAANEMAKRFNDVSNDIKAVRESLNIEIKNQVNEANTYIKRIAELNQSVKNASEGEQGNIIDQRDQALKKLSEIIGVSYFYDGQSNLNVMTTNGEPLVQGTSPSYLVSDPLLDPFNPVSDFQQDIISPGNYGVSVKDTDGNLTSLTQYMLNNENSGGKLSGLLKARDNQLKDYFKQIDQLANAIIRDVNTEHRNGSNLANPSVSAIDFFTPYATPAVPATLPWTEFGAARQMKVAITDPNQIAASNSAAGVAPDPGNNKNLLNVFNLLDQKKYIDTFNNLSYQVNSDIYTATSNTEKDDVLLTQLEKFRQESVGVNLDDELLQLMQHQKAFEASARMMNTVEKMLDTIFSMVR